MMAQPWLPDSPQRHYCPLCPSSRYQHKYEEQNALWTEQLSTLQEYILQASARPHCRWVCKCKCRFRAAGGCASASAGVHPRQAQASRGLEGQLHTSFTWFRHFQLKFHLVLPHLLGWKGGTGLKCDDGALVDI